MPRRPPPPSEPPKRKRRDPEEARRLILEAAERLFSKRTPDTVGLKDVASEAGVSHALVSHYFGSYEVLVEETIARCLSRARESMMALLTSESRGPALLLERLASAAEDPLLLRLAAWALLSGRMRRGDFFSVRARGLKLVADAITARREALELPPIPRDELEFVIMAAITMMLGFGIAKEALLAGLGRPSNGAALKASEEDYRARVLDMLERYIGRSR